MEEKTSRAGCGTGEKKKQNSKLHAPESWRMSIKLVLIAALIAVFGIVAAQNAK